MTSGIWLADNRCVSGEPLTLQLEHTQTPSKVFLWEGVWGGGKASHLTWVRILGSREGLAHVHVNDMTAFADDVVLFGTTGACTGTGRSRLVRSTGQEQLRRQKVAAVWCSEVLICHERLFLRMAVSMRVEFLG